MKIEKLDESDNIEFKELDDDEVMTLVERCFNTRGWYVTGNTLVLYQGENLLPDAVKVYTINRVRTYVDRNSKLWNDKTTPRCSKEEGLLLKEEIYELIKKHSNSK